MEHQFGYTTFNDSISEIIGLNKILSRSTEKELGKRRFDMRRPGKGTDPDMVDLSSDQLNFSIQRIELVEDILLNLKEKYKSKNDTYDDLFRSYRTLVYSYFQSLEVVSRQIGGVKVDLSHISQNSASKPFESVDKETQKSSKYHF